MNEINISNEIITSRLKDELDKPEYKGRLRAVDGDDIKKILNRLVNHIVHDEEETNANALISADDPETAVIYGTILANALEKIISFDVCVPVKEAQLYEWNATLKSKNPKAKVLLVNGLNAPDPGILFKTLTDFEKQKYTPAVILCTTNDVVEKLKEYDVQDQKLYHYLCGLRKITIPGIAQADIADTICDRLEGEGNKVTKAFREKLKVHVEAIYSDAVLQKEAFLEDLIVRIKSVHSEKGVDLWNLYDEEDVPPSDKADALLKKIHGKSEEVVGSENEPEEEESIVNNETPISSNEEVIINEGIEENKDKAEVELKDKCDDVHRDGKLSSVNDYFIKRMISYVNDEKGYYFCESENETEKKDVEETGKYVKKNRHILLLAMSTFPYDKAENKYKLEKNDFTTPENEIINDCRGQLEPIAKMMLNKINDLSTVDFVIVSTKATLERKYCIEYGEDEDQPNKIDTKESEVIINNSPLVYVDDKEDKRIVFHVVKVDEGAPLDGMENTVETIRDIYSGKNNEDISLWLDIHGGYRDVNVMMAALLSLLKNEGIKHDKIYSARFSGEQNVIFEAKDMFDMFDFVTGMNDFFNFGSASVLKTIKDYEISESKKLIDILELISQGTQFSAPYMYIEGIKALIKYMKDNSMKDNRVREKENKLDIFEQNIFNDFGEDFKKFLQMDPESEDFENELIVAIIERCVDKKLYQQALTFIETLMPKFYNKKKYLYYDEKENKEIEKRKDPFMHKDNENLIFDFNLSNLSLYKKNKNKKNEEEYFKQKEASVNEVIKCFCDETKGERLNVTPYIINNLHLTPKDIFKNKNKKVIVKDNAAKDKDKKLQDLDVYLKTDLDNTRKNYVKSLFVLHAALKQCRNMFNHGSNNENERPELENIEKGMMLYIKTVKFLCK